MSRVNPAREELVSKGRPGGVRRKGVNQNTSNSSDNLRGMCNEFMHVLMLSKYIFHVIVFVELVHLTEPK